MTVLEIKQEIQHLTSAEILEIQTFLAEFQAQSFDAQLEQDSASGHFDSLITKLETQIALGDWKPL